MSKRKREAIELGLNQTSETVSKPETSPKNVIDKPSFWKTLTKNQKLFGLGLSLLITIGVFGSGMKYLETSAKQQAELAQTKGHLNSLPENQPSFATKLNPFTTTVTPNPTPQLAKEYVYAGSRMLAVEDANANAAPPADLAIWRPSNGLWCVLGGTGSAQTFFQWGQNGDQTAQGDYDGDGKTDFAVFRLANANNPNTVFWIMKSSDNSYFSIPFGTSGDKVAQADYDGDGKTDVAVFRSSNGTWYWLNSGSNNSFSYLQFGLGSDVPSPADYDGDGKADIGVWRETDKTFYSSNSSNGQLAVGNLQSAGSGNNTPVSADYDGDGRADYAIKSGNNWIIRKSSNNTTDTTPWQNSTDLPVQNDYDGDGKVDIAVWNNTNGTWSIKQSGNGTTRTEQWGMTGDIPVPAYYRR